MKFQAPCGAVLTKIIKCHKIFNFLEIAKAFLCFYSPMTTLFMIKIWIKSDENCRRNSVLKFLPPYDTMLTKTKKFVKIENWKNFEK